MIQRQDGELSPGRGALLQASYFSDCKRLHISTTSHHLGISYHAANKKECSTVFE
ncbi:hypothetical protein Pelsub_P2305 [Pelolinea submarina]|nr:hypothetical protein Pelsub_P2305 [Pelolinea submarina]